MKLILQEEVYKVGHRGQVVDVADGYARNFLLPRNMAIPATEGNLRRLEQIRAQLAKRTATEKAEAEQLAQVMTGVTINLKRKVGESEQMFGSVTAADIADALAAQGYTVEKRRVQLEEPIKNLGEFEVGVKLVHDVGTKVKVIVTREE